MVELGVEIGRPCGIRLGLEVGRDAAQPVHVDARGALGGSRGDRRLQRLAKVEQLDHVTLVLRQVAHDPARELRAVRPPHLCAPPLAAVHEALQRQLVDRLADEAAGYAQEPGELALGRQAAAGRQLARHDHRLEPGGDRLRQADRPGG